MLSHYEAGNPNNPMVVLVHGVCDGAIAWIDLINHLSDRYFVIAFDSLGHGASPRYTKAQLDVPGDAAMNALEEALSYQVNLHKKVPVVVAHSMGAAISSKLSTRRPELFAGLILEDPAWLSSEQKAGYLQRAADQVELSKKWRGDLISTLQDNLAERPHWNTASHSAWTFTKVRVDEALLATGVVSFPERWQDVAKAITVPTVVITSDTEDVLVGTAGVQAIRDLHNSALRVEIIPGTSHGVRLDAPEAYNAIVDSRLEAWL